MHYFFEEDLRTDVIVLSPEESAHCARVLRLREGQQIALTDGKGTYAMASLLSVTPKGTTATITKRDFTPKRNFHLHLAVAPTKNIDRFEWLLEKATECGVDQITPIICTQSERTIVKHDRLQKILVAAMKQSQRVWLPELSEMVKFDAFVKGLDRSSGTYIAHCGDGIKSPVRKLYPPGTDALIIIGPEGDFTSEEVHMAMEMGAQAISLGESRLRTETAALVACVEVNFLNGELGG